MKAKLAKSSKLKVKVKKPKSKGQVRTHDISASDDSTPWDEDDTSADVPKTAKDIKKAAKELGVRGYGEPEEDDEDDRLDEEASVKFNRKMRRAAKRVSAADRPYNGPATSELVTREALASVLRQIPKAERNYKASGAERAAYAYTNLINNARELMADLRAMSSTDALADRVIAESVNPAFMQLVNFMIGEIGNMRTKVNSSNNIDALRRSIHEQLNKMLEEIGGYGQETLDKATENARKALRN